MLIIKKQKRFYFRIFICFVTLLVVGIVYKGKSDTRISNLSNTNLILITVDTLRADHLGVYGYEKNTTPNLDRWSQGAYVFTNAYTTIPKTSPSLTSIITGLDPATHRIFDVGYPPIDTKLNTLTKILKKSGYETAAFVTNRFVDEAQGKKANFQIGFDEWHHYRIDISKQYYDSIAWLNKKHTKPFFLWIHLIYPHAPYYPPTELACTFNNRYCSQIKEKSLVDYEQIRADIRGQSNGCRTKHVPTQTVELYETLYDGEIGLVDRIFGLYVNNFQRNKFTKNTTIVFTADHGEGFDHDYNFQHATLYQSNIRIPLIIKTPSMKNTKARYNDSLISNSDLMPTLLENLGVKASLNIDGVSFHNVIGGEEKISKRKYLIAINHVKKYFSIQDQQYKYIYSPQPNCLFTGKQEELYNYVMDPEELNDLSGLPQTTEVKQQLKAELIRYLRQKNLF